MMILNPVRLTMTLAITQGAVQACGVTEGIGHKDNKSTEIPETWTRGVLDLCCQWRRSKEAVSIVTKHVQLCPPCAFNSLAFQ